MGRYAERCEASARLLRSVLTRLSSRDDDDDNVLPDLLAACRRIDILPKADKPMTPGETEKMVIAAVCNPKVAGSVASNIQALSFSADQVRERLSSDNWHALTRLSRLFETPSATTSFALTTLDRVMLDCISLAGFAMDDMTRDEGWRFLILGRRIERLAGLGALVAGVLASPGNPGSAAWNGCWRPPTPSSPTAPATAARRKCCPSSTSWCSTTPTPIR